MRRAKTLPDAHELDSYTVAEMSRYPRMSLFKEASLGRIIEESKGMKGKRYLTEQATEYLIGNKLRWISVIARSYSSLTSGSMSINDLYQVGCEKLVSAFPWWDWKLGALSTYLHSGIYSALSRAVSEDRGKTEYTDERIQAIREAKNMWESVKGESPNNRILAQAIVIYHLQPDQKLTSQEANLRESVLEMANTLGIFSHDKHQSSDEDLMERSLARLDAFESMENLSQTVDGDQPLDSEDDDTTLMDQQGVEMDRSHLAVEKHLRFEELVEKGLVGLSERQQRSVRFMLLGERRTIKELARHLGVPEKRAQNIYDNACTGMRTKNRMAMLNLKNFLADEGYY